MSRRSSGVVLRVCNICEIFHSFIEKKNSYEMKLDIVILYMK